MYEHAPFRRGARLAPKEEMGTAAMVTPLSWASAVGASICCVGPLLLLALGVSGAWIGSLTEFEPYRPYLIGLTLIFLAMSFRKLYMVPRVCVPGTLCANAWSLRRQRRMFWVVCLLLFALIAMPWVAPFFTERNRT